MPRSYLNLIGVAILVIGMGSVVLIERNVQKESDGMEDTEETDQLLHPEDSRVYVHSAEMMGGKFGMIMDGWVQGIEGLGHSRGFAITIAVVSLVSAAGVFMASTRSSPK